MSTVIPALAGSLLRAASQEASRYAMQGIRVKVFESAYRLEATDGRVAAILRGPHGLPGTFKSPAPPPLPDAPNGSAWDNYCFNVPPDAWKQAFGALAKSSPVRVGCTPEHDIVLVGQGGTLTSRELEGRFPDIDGVLPAAGPVVRFAVNPTQLIRVLEIVRALFRDDGGHGERADVLFYGEGLPIGIVARNGDVTLDCIVMPLNDDPTRYASPPEQEATAAQGDPDDDDEDDKEDDYGSPLEDEDDLADHTGAYTTALPEPPPNGQETPAK